MAEMSATPTQVEVPLKTASGPGDDKVHTWPNLVRAEFLCTLFTIIFLLLWSLLVDAPLEEPADPGLAKQETKKRKKKKGEDDQAMATEQSQEEIGKKSPKRSPR